VVFLVDAQNLRSRRAVEKLGATECGERRGMVLYALHWLLVTTGSSDVRGNPTSARPFEQGA